jgi:hypothetical protein
MKYLSLIFVLNFTLFILKAEIDTKGIPQGATGIIYLDQENFSLTDLYKNSNFLNPEHRLESNKLSEFYLKDLGVKNIKDVVVGTYSIVGSANKPFVGIFHGSFSKKKLEEFTTQNKIQSKVIQGFQCWDMTEVIESIASINKIESVDIKDKNQVLLVAYSDDLLFFASEQLVSRAIDTLNQKKPSHQLPSEFTDKHKNYYFGFKPWLSFYGDFTKEPAPAGLEGPRHMQVFVGEEKSLVEFRCINDFTNERKATNFTEQLKALKSVMIMSLNSSPDNESMSKDNKEIFAQILDKMEISTFKTSQKISVNYPSKKVAEIMASSSKQSMPPEKIVKEKN